MKRKTSYQRGIKAEFLAKIYLRLKGYRILAHRYKTPVGEIDLIAKRRQILIFIEVKTRKSMARALESVSHTQQKRIRRAALYYLNSVNKYEKYMMRFDVICIDRTFLPKHLENVWQMWH